MPLSLRLQTGLPSGSYLNLDSYQNTNVNSKHKASVHSNVQNNKKDKDDNNNKKNKNNSNHDGNKTSITNSASASTRTRTGIVSVSDSGIVKGKGKSGGKNEIISSSSSSSFSKMNDIIKEKQDRHAMQVHATKRIEVNSDCNPLVQSLLGSSKPTSTTAKSISISSSNDNSNNNKNNSASSLSRFSKEEMLQNVRVLQLRNEFNPSRFYKRTSQIEVDKAQLGTVIAGRFDDPSMKLTRKERKATFAEEILTDPSIRKYTKKRFDAIQMKGQSKIKVYNDHNKMKKQMISKNKKGVRKVQHDYGYGKNSVQERRHKAGDTTVNIGGKKRPFKY